MQKELRGVFPALLRYSPSKLHLGMTILLATLEGQAAGLGAVRIEPIIGEPLYVEIPLLGQDEDTLSDGCFRINRPSDPTDAENFPRDASVRLIKRGGEQFIVVASRQLVHTPIVEFRVVMGCNYNVARDYLFLPSVAAKPESGPSSGFARSTANTAQSVLAAAAGERTSTLPDGLTAKSHTVDRSMRLDELARIYFPGQPLRSERFMRWVVEANPALFKGASNLRQHSIEKGTNLLVPLTIPPRRPGDHQGNNGRLKFLDAATDQQAPVKAHIQPDPPPPINRLSASIDKTIRLKDRLQISGGASRDELPRGAKAMALLTERLGSLEGAQETEKSKTEERFRRMEASLAELSSYVAKLENKHRKQEALLKAERDNAKDARASLQVMQLLLAILGGALLVVFFLIALQKKYKKDKQDTQEYFDEPIASMAEAATTLAEGPAPRMAANAPMGTTQEILPEPSYLSTQVLKVEPVPPEPIVQPTPFSSEAMDIRTEWEFEPGGDTLDLDVESQLVLTSETPSGDNSAATAMPSKEDETRITLELVDVMVSMGLSDSAAQTLIEHTHEKPRQSPLHWLKLLELFRQLGREQDFERTSREVRKYFNIQPPNWNRYSVESMASLEDYPHIMAVLRQVWNSEDCEDFLYDLITDNRGGTREGFPLSVAEEILLLIEVKSGTAQAA